MSLYLGYDLAPEAEGEGACRSAEDILCRWTRGHLLGGRCFLVLVDCPWRWGLGEGRDQFRG